MRLHSNRMQFVGKWTKDMFSILQENNDVFQLLMNAVSRNEPLQQSDMAADTDIIHEELWPRQQQQQRNPKKHLTKVELIAQSAFVLAVG